MSVDIHSFLLHSPITLSSTYTEVKLEDYSLCMHDIESIECSDDTIDIWLNVKRELISLNVLNFNLLHWVSTITFRMKNEETYSILLLKSQKIKHTIEFHGQASTVQIAGDFNSWNPKNHSFLFHHGVWRTQLHIEPGIYSYQLIVNGNWINDPANSEVLENGYGGYNSLLRVPQPTIKHLSIHTASIASSSFTLSVNGDYTDCYALWQNTLIADVNIIKEPNKIIIHIPQEASKLKRTYIRVMCSNATTRSNDILVPLEYGKVLDSHTQLTRDDKEAQAIYFLLVDRFYNNSTIPKKNTPSYNIHPKLDFYGGTISGIEEKLKEGYFTRLGINTLWISPVVKNPDYTNSKNGNEYIGYHGYWPIDSTKIDERFGSSKDLSKLINSAHNIGINVIIDYVANHVHEDNPLIKNNPDWSTPLILEDGSKNIGRWEEHRFTTWFDEFLPTLNFDKPEVLETMTDIALDWIKTYKFDGFRHDATKHIPETFWRLLTKKLKQEIVIPQAKRLFQIGETFGGRDMLRNYVNSGIHDGQFSFNLYYESRAAFLYEDVHFEKLVISLNQEFQSFGYHHLMGNISGNHDMPRFISYAGEDLWMNQNAEHEGWSRHISVKNPIGYRKLLMLMAFNCTIPGVPVVYYGDEFGMPGGGDPDNRRPMKFSGLKPYEITTLKHTQNLLSLRTHFLPLMYGDFTFLRIDSKILIYKRSYFSECAYIIFNKSAENKEIIIDNCKYCIKQIKSIHSTKIEIKDSKIIIQLKAMSYDILFTHHDYDEEYEVVNDYFF